MSKRRPPCGMTMIEVLASTMLSALLMAALLGVLRGLKTQERALRISSPHAPWKESLDAVLAADLAGARTYAATPQSLRLEGFGARNTDGVATWLPSTVDYFVQTLDKQSWLVRREQSIANGGPSRPANLVLAGVSEIRVSRASDTTESEAGVAQQPGAVDSGQAMPIATDLVVEFWGTTAQPLYTHRHHAP